MSKTAVLSNGEHQLLEERLALGSRLFGHRQQGKAFGMNQMPIADKQAHKRNILIVDDMPAILSILYDLFTRLGYDVRTVSNGEAALRAALTMPPDLVLLDIDLPDMLGFDVCRQLKSEQTTRNIPVIFMSGAEATQNKAKALAVGGSDYLAKPFGIREAIAAVKACLN